MPEKAGSGPWHHRLSVRLFALVMFISTVLALGSTTYQLYREFLAERSELDQRLAQIQLTTVQSLAASLWAFNEPQLRLQLGGIMRIPGIRFASLNSSTGSRLEFGQQLRRPELERRYELRYGSRVLGELKVEASLDHVRSKLAAEAATILVTEGAKASTLAFLLLFITNRWVTRRLVRLAGAVRDTHLDRLSAADLTLPGIPPARDELDEVSHAFLEMRLALAEGLKKRAAHDAERQQLLTEIERSHFLMQAIIDNTPAIIYVRDLQSRLLLVNQRYGELFTGGQNVLGIPARELYPGESTQIELSDQRVVRTRQPVEYEFQVEQAGLTRTFLTVKFPLRDQAGHIFAVGCIASDITQRKRDEERIQFLAHHDPLTRLPNRVLLRDRIDQAVSRARRDSDSVAVLLVDLDHFKDVNDSMGHGVGDQLLIEVANRLRSGRRDGDTVARLGGDEFVIVLGGLRSDSAVLGVAEEILQQLRPPMLIGDEQLHITASIGIALYPADGDDATTLTQGADTAMYHAKEAGRDACRFFAPSMNQAALRRVQLARGMRLALERGDFYVEYQPQVDLESGQVFGGEALVRWRAHWGETIAASEFIPIAEETGFISAIGDWVLQTACHEAARWHRQGHHHLTVSVNLSPRQLMRPDFDRQVAELLHATGLAPSALELEITEGVLLRRTEENLSILSRLAESGVRLAIDDFGTGYSSLAYLQRFPVSVVKIDRAFVSAISSGETAIITAIIAMALGLRMKVIAEGVENIEQARFLASHGAFAVQGFLFSRSVNGDRFLDLVTHAPWGMAPLESRWMSFSEI